jgi:hypothetical protein
MIKQLTAKTPIFQKSSFDPKPKPNPDPNHSPAFTFGAPTVPVPELKYAFVIDANRNQNYSNTGKENIDKPLPAEILEKNANSVLPYKRRARSFSPPKDPFKIIEKDSIFPNNAPIIPVPRVSKLLMEDINMLAAREEYLRLLETAQETVTTESEDTSREYQGILFL